MTNVAHEIEEEEEKEVKLESLVKFEEKPIEVVGDEGEYVNCIIQRILFSLKQIAPMQ